MGYQCLEKYLSYPTAIDVSRIPNHQVIDRIAITLVPMKHQPSNPPPLNITDLKKCGLELSDLEKGHFVGKGSTDCEDPVQFWDMVLLSLEDFGIKVAEVIYFDGEYEKFPMEKLQWKIRLFGNRRSCLTLGLPKLKKDVVKVIFTLDKNLTYEVYVHEKDAFNIFKKHLSRERSKFHLTSDHGRSAILSFHIFNSFPTFEDDCLEANKVYSYSDCEIENYDQVSYSNNQMIHNFKLSLQRLLKGNLVVLLHLVRKRKTFALM